VTKYINISPLKALLLLWKAYDIKLKNDAQSMVSIKMKEGSELNDCPATNICTEIYIQ
jgi:hypothetical protein